MTVLDRLLGAPVPGPPEALRRGPFRADAFSSPLHSERRAARSGVWLGLAFAVCFATGLVSHLVQHPPGWFVWPASPSWLYRVTQGLHVATGLAAVPLLLVKLWTVYPALFAWPVAGTVARVVSRLSVLVLVGAAAMQLVTGIINTAQWYPFGFFFPVAHYWTAWIAIGAVAVHVGAKAPEIRRGLARRSSPVADAAEVRAEESGPVPRRAFVLAAGLGVGAVTLTTAGQTFSPLGAVSLLAPRQPGVGPQGLPVRQTARAAGVTDVGPGYRLVVEGPDRLELTLADLAAFPSAPSGCRSPASRAGARTRRGPGSGSATCSPRRGCRGTPRSSSSRCRSAGCTGARPWRPRTPAVPGRCWPPG